MRILRVFNNNIVATKDAENREAIAQGSGIGFSKKPGDLLDLKRVDKFYYILSEHQSRFNDLFDETPIEYFQIAEKIIDKVKSDLQMDLSNQIVLALTDHIHFAVIREKEGAKLANLMLGEIRTLYHDEFELALWSIEYIKEVVGVSLPIDEAGFIALHIVNASLGIESSQTSNILFFSKGVLDIIKEFYELDLDTESYTSSRLMSHLKFLAFRLFRKEPQKFTELNDMYQLLVGKDIQLEKCLNLIDDFVMNSFSYKLSTQERVYLMVHIIRLL